MYVSYVHRRWSDGTQPTSCPPSTYACHRETNPSAAVYQGPLLLDNVTSQPHSAPCIDVVPPHCSW